MQTFAMSLQTSTSKEPRQISEGHCGSTGNGSKSRTLVEGAFGVALRKCL